MDAHQDSDEFKMIKSKVLGAITRNLTEARVRTDHTVEAEISRVANLNGDNLCKKSVREIAAMFGHGTLTRPPKVKASEVVDHLRFSNDLIDRIESVGIEP